MGRAGTLRRRDRCAAAAEVLAWPSRVRQSVPTACRRSYSRRSAPRCLRRKQQTTVSPGQDSAVFTFAAEVQHTLVFRFTNTSVNACSLSTPTLGSVQTCSTVAQASRMAFVRESLLFRTLSSSLCNRLNSIGYRKCIGHLFRTDANARYWQGRQAFGYDKRRTRGPASTIRHRFVRRRRTDLLDGRRRAEHADVRMPESARSDSSRRLPTTRSGCGESAVAFGAV